MKIYPAIDLKEGRCVRLIRGGAKSRQSMRRPDRVGEALGG